jgi:hypothetical protein
MIDETQDAATLAKEPEPWEFRAKPAWQRLIIMLGGVTVNLLLGFFIYIMVVFAYGEEKLNQWNSLLRASSYVDWECNNLNSLLNEFVETHNVIFQQKSKEYKDEYILRREAHAFNKAFTYIESLSDAKTLLMKYGDKDLYEIFLKFVAAKFIEQTRYGSQIHQNNACFVYMGLPIVKLDSIYRGMMNDADVYKFKPLMDVAEYELLESLLFQKPFGDNIYFGWKKLAFQMGLI